MRGIMEIFSGEYSRTMWNEINQAKTIEDLKDALYTVCCRLQELETQINSTKQKTFKCYICGSREGQKHLDICSAGGGIIKSKNDE